MAPTSSTNLSPAELAYLHSSLSLTPPIRPDARTTTQFRPVIAETDILPSTNGSARICFADGTEAVVGVKAEVEKTKTMLRLEDFLVDQAENEGQEQWVEMSVEIPGFRDDDGLPIFLAEMLREGLVGEEGLQKRLVINRGWHWRLFIDILLLSPPLSYPLPLLSLTTHLALISTKLPALKSQDEEDPLFDDDWAAAVSLYNHETPQSAKKRKGKGAPPKQLTPGPTPISRPPVTLLVICIGNNIIFDPSAEEVAAAETVVAITITKNHLTSHQLESGEQPMSLRSLRMIDPPARMSQPGVALESTLQTGDEVQGVWKPPRGGVKREMISHMVKMTLEKGGVGEEVLAGLEAAIDGNLSTIAGEPRRAQREGPDDGGKENTGPKKITKTSVFGAYMAKEARGIVDTAEVKLDHRSSMPGPERRRFYIGNLSYTASEEDLMELFKDFSVESVTIPFNPRVNRPVGYAFVEVRESGEASRAIDQLSGTSLKGRKISVRVASFPNGEVVETGHTESHTVALHD